jgi:exopolyphosphatase/pppGpp-phosphohydrolase
MAMNVPSSQPAKSIDHVVAAFDIGSNSIKMTIARSAGAGIVELASRSDTVRLGQGVDESGVLDGERMAAAMAAFKQFSDLARSLGATRLIGVATEATRTAANGQAFLDRVSSATGIELSAISGEREAELTFLGLDGVIDLDDDVIVADIGGGSTEIIVARDRGVRFSKSYPIGSGRLTEQFVRHDPPTADELGRVFNAAKPALAEAPFDETPKARLYITGGTGEFAFRLIAPQTEAQAMDIDRMLAQLESISANELAEKISIPVARARVLPAGVAVVRLVADLAKPSGIYAAQSGIRRGLLLAAFAGQL